MRLIALAIAAVIMTGCAILSEQGPTTQMLTIKYATLKALNGDTEKAATWSKWVDEGIEFIESDAEVKVSELDVALRKRIKWESLRPEESLLIDAVILEIRTQLINEIGDGILQSDNKVLLVNLLKWSKEAAQSIK